MDAPAYFDRTGPGSFAPTPRAGGAWSAEDYHFSPVGGLLVYCLEAARENDLRLARVSFDILGRLPFADVDVEVEVLRPGRTIELSQATATIAGRTVITARAWYLAESDTADVAGTDDAPLPPPEECPERALDELWPGGYIGQLEARQARPLRAGRGATWITSPARVVAGEERSTVADYVARIDTANGIAVRRSPEEWAFPNVDLTVHLYRRPTGRWNGFDTTVSWGAEGIGLTSSVLHDVRGPLGRAEQSLTLRRA